MTTNDVHIALVGAGRWGTLHAEKISRIGGARLAAVVDPVAERARTIAQQHPGCIALADFDSLPDTIEAVTITTPSTALYEVGMKALEYGFDVLIEKPMANSPTDASQLVTKAQAGDQLLVTGLVERFNPALLGFPGVNHSLRIRRWGTGQPAASGLGLDWAIHDLDLAQWLCRCALQLVGAVEHKNALLMTLLGTDGRTVQLDIRSNMPHVCREVVADGFRYDLWNPGGDALYAELSAFVNAIRSRKTGQLALGRDALSALVLLDAGRRYALAAA